MADSFTELRAAGGSTRPWTVGAVAVLVVASLAALAAAVWTLSRPADQRSAIPQVVTVTAQPGTPADGGAGPTPGTYTGWLFSAGRAGESGWNAVLTLAPRSATLTHLNDGCTELLRRGEDGQWSAQPLQKKCPAAGDAWTLEEAEPGVVVLRREDGGNALVEGSLSLDEGQQ